jgi:hypothetical protein
VKNEKGAKKVRLWPEGGIEVGELLRAKTTGGRRSLFLSYRRLPVMSIKNERQFECLCYLGWSV